MSFLGLGGGGGLDVGTVKATLGYEHDKRGLKEWDRAVDGARREARKPIEADLKADYDGRGFDRYDRSVEKSTRSNHIFARTSTGLASGMRLVAYGAGAAGLAIGVGFVAFTRKAIDASSDLNESLNAANAIFEQQGPVIEKWSKKTADSFGFAQSESLQFASSIGAMLKPMGFSIDSASKMSRKMVELAGDMASFNNQDPAEMLERLRSGLAGESEPLRQFGVDLRVTATEAFALKEGIIKSGEKLEGQKQVYAFYRKILHDTADQQGDFGRTSEGMANAQRRLKANVTDLTATFGTAFRPVMQGALADMNDFLVQMKEGRGEGGKFADFLSTIGNDVEGFAKKIEHVLSDKSLEPQQKAEKIFGLFGQVAGQAITKAIPAIADAAASAAPKVAERFVQGFLHANAWGKLALGAFLIAKFGGFGAFRGIGAKLGAGIGTGVAEGAAATVAGEAAGGVAGGAAGGLGGRLRGVLGAAGIVAKRIGVIGLGYAIGETVIGGIQYEIEKGSDNIDEALGTIASHGKGLFGFGNRLMDQITGEQGESEQAKAILHLYDSLAEKRGNIAEIAQRDIEGQAKELDLTQKQRQEVQRMFNLLKAGRRLGKGRTSIGVDLSMDPKKLEEIQTGLDRLKAGVYTNASDIEKASRRLNHTIIEQFGQGTKEARVLTAENMRATAAAIALRMKEAGNFTEDGVNRIKRLMRNADLLQGLKPGEFGRKFANAFGRAGDVTKDEIDKVIAQFKRMPKGARQAAFEAMNDQLRELRRGGKLSQGQVKEIRSALLAEFGGLKREATGSTFDLVKGVLGNFGVLGNGVAAALEVIRDNTNAGLSSFNVSPVKWIVKTIGNLLGGGGGGGKPNKKARGGYLEGPSRGDVVPVLAGKDEAFVTSWQQRPINAALQFSAAHGVQPYPHLGALFAGEQQPHATGPTVQRRAKGGYAYPGVTVENNQRKDGEVGAVNKAMATMERLAQLHIPYVWGGGHGGFDPTPAGLDCSGAVSLVLHEAGLLASPLVSGALESWGAPGPGAITVYANPTHAWMEVNGRPWGTSVNDSSHGLGFYPEPSAGYKSTFTARHAAGAVATELARVLIQGPDGPMKEFAQGAVDRVWKGADAYLKANMPNTFGGGDANVAALKGGKTVGASTYHPDAYTGTVGAAGKSLVGKMAFAELGMGHNLGGLPFGAKLKIAHGGRTVIGEKLDIGAGGGDVEGHRRDIDLWYETANALGLPSDWLGLVQIAKAARGGWVRRQNGGFAIGEGEKAESPGVTMGKIMALYSRLGKTKNKGKRDELLDKIHGLQKRLSRRRAKKRKARYKSIADEGNMPGWAKRITESQDSLAHVEEQIGGIEQVNGLTEPRSIEAILEGLGLDPETDLSAPKMSADQRGVYERLGIDPATPPRKLSEAQKKDLRKAGINPETEWSKLSDEQEAAIRGAIDSDYAREEAELRQEVDYNNRQLKGLLNLRSLLLRAIQEAKVRIARAERAARHAEDEQDRLQKEAAQVKKEIEKLRDDLQDLERGNPPKRQKGESKKDHEDKVKAWENDRKGSKRRIQESIERHQERHHDLVERARAWGSVAKAQHAKAHSLGEWVGGDLEPDLVDVQGTDRSRDPDVAVAPLGQGAPQFGGEILASQTKLAELGSTRFVRPDPFAGRGTGAEEEEAANTEQEEREAQEERLKEERLQLLEEENERYRRNAAVMGAQAPIFAAARPFPNLLARGGFAAMAGMASMVSPFVGSYRIGSQFIPRDGFAMVHRGETINSKERVAETGTGDVYVRMTGGLEWLAPYVQAHIEDELEARGEQAAAARRRPAAGVIARRLP
jgi:hypothetical protein